MSKVVVIVPAQGRPFVADELGYNAAIQESHIRHPDGEQYNFWIPARQVIHLDGEVAQAVNDLRVRLVRDGGE